MQRQLDDVEHEPRENVERRFVHLAKKGMDALRRAVRALEETVARRPPPRAGGPQQGQDRAAIQRIIDNSHEADFNFQLCARFSEPMDEAFDRYYKPSLYRHIEPGMENPADWHLVQRVSFGTDVAWRFVQLVRSKAGAHTHEGIRRAFDRQMSIEETAWRFVRDAANAGRESPELREVRDDFRREFLEVLGPDLERMGIDPGTQETMALEAIEEVENAARDTPSLSLRAAFSLKLATAERDVQELKRRRGPGGATRPNGQRTRTLSQEHARPEEATARQYGAQGELRMQRKDYDDADRCFAAASAIYEALGHQRDSARMLERRGESLFLKGNRDAAREQWNRALARYGNVREHDAARQLRQAMTKKLSLG